MVKIVVLTFKILREFGPFHQFRPLTLRKPGGNTADFRVIGQADNPAETEGRLTGNSLRRIILRGMLRTSCRTSGK